MSNENNTLFLEAQQALLSEALGDADPGQLQALAQQLQRSRVDPESRELYISAYRAVERARRAFNALKTKYQLFGRQSPWLNEAVAAVERDIEEEQK